MKYLDSVFDTRIDTKKMFVSININFVPRTYKNKKGLSLVYLHATKEGKRIRLPLDIYVPRKLWCNNTQRILSNDTHWKDINLIIDNVESRITSIRTTYRLANKHLSLSQFEEEFVRGIPRVNFYAFAYWYLEKQRNRLAAGTYRKQKATLSKFQRWKPVVYFTEIDRKFVMNLRQWMHSIGNKKTTIETNICTFKTFLNAAKDQGILLPIDPADIKVGNTTGTRVDLSATEMKKLIAYYQSDFIPDNRRLILGYFLFSCFTGLRISEVLSIDREQFQQSFFEFYEAKKDRMQRRKINDSTRMLLDYCDELFVTKLHPNYLNREIKHIVKHCGIKKKVSFHVGRHTFATNFLRAGGDAVSLQQLLGHSSLRQTLIYVHIVESEVNEKVFIIDKLFQ